MKNLLVLCNNAPGFEVSFKKIIETLSKTPDIRLVLAIEEPCFANDLKINAVKYILSDNPCDSNSSDPSNGFLSTMFNVELDRFLVYDLPSNKIETKLRNYYHFFQRIFKENDIDGVLWEVCSNTFSMIAYELKPKNCRFIGLIDSRINGFFEIWPDIHFDFDDYLDNDYGQAKITLNDLSSPPSYMGKKKSFLKTNVIIKILQDIYNNTNNIGFYSNRFLLRYNRLKMRIQNGFCKLLTQKYIYQPNPADKYFLYALSVRPECSTTIYGSYIYSDIEIIRLISNSLPENALLYVKLHPNDISVSSKFYRDISKIPFVRIIEEQFSTRKLIENTLGCITISGTVGFESILSSKPVVLLGRANYSFHSLCFKIKNFTELPAVLSDLYKSASKHQIDKEDFLNVYSRFTFRGKLDLNNLGFGDVESISHCCDVISLILRKN